MESKDSPSSVDSLILTFPLPNRLRTVLTSLSLQAAMRVRENMLQEKIMNQYLISIYIYPLFCLKIYLRFITASTTHFC